MIEDTATVARIDDDLVALHVVLEIVVAGHRVGFERRAGPHLELAGEAITVALILHVPIFILLRHRPAIAETVAGLQDTAVVVEPVVHRVGGHMGFGVAAQRLIVGRHGDTVLLLATEGAAAGGVEAIARIVLIARLAHIVGVA